MARRTAADAAKTRDRLLDAALHVFADKGVAMSTLDDVARAAGVTRGAVYWHFEDKSALLAQTLGRQRLPLEELVLAGSLQDDRGQLLRAVSRTACEPPHGLIVKILVQQSEWDYAQNIVRTRIVQARRSFMAYLGRMLAEAQRRQELPPRHGPEALDGLAWALQCSVTGVIFESVLLSGTRRRQRVERTTALLLQQILGEATPDQAAPAQPTTTRVASAITSSRALASAASRQV